MGIRFDLQSFFRTGAEVAQASFEGRLAAQQELARQAQQRLAQQNVLSEIAYRNAQQARWPGEDAFRERNLKREIAGGLASVGDTVGAASLDAQALGGTGRPEPAPPQPPTGPTPFPASAQVMAPQPPLQIQAPRGTPTAGIMQRWGLGGAQGMPPSQPQPLPTPVQVPPAKATPPTFAYPGGRVTAQEDIRKDAAALYTGLRQTFAAARTAVGLTPEVQAQVAGLEQRAAAIGYPHTPEQIQELGDIQAQVNAAVQGKVGPGPGIAARQETAADRLKQSREIADQTQLDSLLKYSVSPAFLQSSKESKIPLIRQIANLMDRLGLPKVLPPELEAQMTPYQKAVIGIREPLAEEQKKNIESQIGKREFDKNMELKKFEQQKKVQKFHMDQITKGKQAKIFNDAEAKQLAEFQKTENQYNSTLNGLLKKYGDILPPGFNALYPDPNRPEQMEINDAYLHREQYKQATRNLFAAKGYDIDKYKPRMPEAPPPKARTRTEVTPGGGWGPFQRPDVTTTRTVLPPPRRGLESIGGTAAPRQPATQPQGPPAARASQSDVAMIRGYIERGRFSDLMGSPITQDPAMRQRAKSAFRQVTGHEWKGERMR